MPSKQQPITNPKVEQDLQATLQSMSQWRANKRSGEQIPETLWRKIFALTPFFSTSQIRSLLGISKKQYDARYEQIINGSTSKSNPSPQHKASVADTLCEVLTNEPAASQAHSTTPKHTSIYRPNPDYKGDTLVVEIFRSDGQRMAIHMTRQQIPELLNAFCPREGETHATTHP